MSWAANKAGWLFLCGVLPLVALYYAIAPVALGHAQAVDFHVAYYPAAEAILAGEDFYPTGGFIVRPPEGLIVDYVYPPLVALVTVPWTVLPVEVAALAFQFVLIGVFVATLAILGVRDWRCYGLAFLWTPVTDAVGTGNVTIFLALAAALAWRFRDRPLATGASIGVSLAAKLFLWPLALWLAVTRRFGAALWCVGTAAAILVASWAVVGFRGLAEYPGLVRRLTETMDDRSYTVYALGLDLGLSPFAALLAWLALGLGMLVAMVVVARHGDDSRAFVLALGAALAFSAIVWLHYFVLLLVIVAVVQPRLGAIWFVGLPMQVVVSTGLYNGSMFRTVVVLGTAAAVIVLAVRPSLERRSRLSLPVAPQP